MRGHTFIAKKTDRSTFAKRGAGLSVNTLCRVLKLCRCENCSYFCTLPLGKALRLRTVIDADVLGRSTFQGHPQQEHETSHGSMTQTRWAVDGPDGTSLELAGRKFSSNDEGAPMMCNLLCSSMGRHAHISFCRGEERGRCAGAEVQHINERMIPDPDKPKDAITHGLYWRRMGVYAILILRPLRLKLCP